MSDLLCTACKGKGSNSKGGICIPCGGEGLLLKVKYGKKNCVHKWVVRSDANEIHPQVIGCVCKECGAFGYIPVGKATEIDWEHEPLPSNGNPNGKWENPFVVDCDIKIWY